MAGCEGSGSYDLPVYRLSDSTDVPVIVAPEHDPTIAGPFEISEQPVITIGDETGAALWKVSAAVRLSTGSIIVADRGNVELRKFDPAGRFVRTIGGEGEGPGEFRSVGTIRVLEADTILMLSPIDRRLIWYTSEGQYARGAKLNVPYHPEVLLPWGGVALRIENTPLQAGYSRPRSLWATVKPSEPPETDTIGWFAGSIVRKVDERDIRFLLFSPTTHIAAGANHIYVGDGAVYEIGQYDRKGRLVRIISRLCRLEPVGEDAKLARGSQMMELLRSVPGPERAEALRRSEIEQEFWDWLPCFEQLIVDDEDRLWVMEKSRFGDPLQRWAVYDSSGAHIGDVDMPVGAERVLSIGYGSVLTLDGPPEISNGTAVRVYQLVQRY